MNKMLIFMTVSLSFAAELPAYAKLKERDRERSLEYWERSAYHEGVKDGYETGVSNDDYSQELDSIAYQIGFIDGTDKWEAEQTTDNNPQL
jgi:hypothetical protein